MYLGDFRIAKTVVCRFNTRQATGAPITLAGTPACSVYKNSTTESTTGVTLTVDYDSRTGLHSVAVDTSADGTFYAAGNDFDIVITAGTVDSISVVGVKVGTFSLENRSPLMPTTDGRKLDVSTGGEAGLDWANVGGPTTTLNLSGTTVKTATDVETDTADIQTRIPAALVGGRMDSNVGAVSGDATAADNAESFFDGTGYAGTNNVIPTVTTLTNLPTMPTDWLTAAGLSAGAVAEIQSGLATAAALATVAGYIDTEITTLVTDVGTLLTRLSAVRAAGLDRLRTDAVLRVAKTGAVTAYVPSTTAPADVGAAMQTALTAASAGDTICVFQDSVNTANLYKAGVHWHFGDVRVEGDDGVSLFTFGSDTQEVHVSGRGRFVPVGDAAVIYGTAFYGSFRCASLTRDSGGNLTDIDDGAFALEADYAVGNLVLFGAAAAVQIGNLIGAVSVAPTVGTGAAVIRNSRIDTSGSAVPSVTMTGDSLTLQACDVRTQAGQHSFYSGSTGTVRLTAGANYDGTVAAGVTVLRPDVATLESRLTATRAGYLDNLSAGATATAAALSSVASALTTAAADVATLLGKFAGVTLLANWLRNGFRKGNPDPTATAEINANNGTGTGDYDPTTDSPQALRDRGDGAWTTATGFAVAGDIPTASQTAAAVLAAGDIDGFSLEQTLKLCLAALAGKLSGGATATVVVRAADDSKPRITATVDADGNRSSVVLDATG